MARRRAKSTVVQRMEDIPTFASEEEEAQYWSEHELSDELLDRMGPLGEDLLPPPRIPARPVSVRFEPQLLERLRALARRRGMRYQTLLKQFVLERLYEEEQREGLVRRHRRGGTSAKRPPTRKSQRPARPG
jgi:predicted DNA binding CopG/RHH family protein